MPILFQNTNIRHLLCMHITKQAEQDTYLIAQNKLQWCPPPATKQIHTQLPKFAVGALPISVA